jgi:hypothetical protein
LAGAVKLTIGGLLPVLHDELADITPAEVTFNVAPAPHGPVTALTTEPTALTSFV